MCHKQGMLSFFNQFTEIPARTVMQVIFKSGTGNNGCQTFGRVRDFGQNEHTVQPSHHFRFIAAIISVAVVVSCGAIPAWAAERDYAIPSGGDFHPPHSVVEKTLDSIFKRDMRDSGVMNYVISAPYRDVKKDEVYARLFTPALRKSASEAEAKEVTEKCGGVYTGDLCGLDFDPILCAQDFPNKGVLYRLESEDKDKAIITTRWPWIEEPLGTYTLIRKGKSWALDGILCQNGLGNFNFSDFDAIKGLTSKPREE